MSLTEPYENPGFHLPTLCVACTRRVDLTGDNPTCTSFPEGIPEEIVTFGADHRTSLAGEPPFELDPERQAEYDDWTATHA
jgi:hypothetical protein